MKSMDKKEDIQFHPWNTAYIFSGVKYNFFKYKLHLINIFPNFIAFYIYIRIVSCSFINIEILNVVAPNETNIFGCLHFSMQNIEMSYDIDRAFRRSNVSVSQ